MEFINSSVLRQIQESVKANENSEVTTTNFLLLPIIKNTGVEN